MKALKILVVILVIIEAGLVGAWINSRSTKHSCSMVEETVEVTTETVSPQPGDTDGWRIYWIDPDTGEGIWVSKEYIEEREFNERRTSYFEKE